MWLVDDTSLACWRPVMKIVGLSVVSLASDTCSPGAGSVISMTEISRPRYDFPALYALTSGYAASLPMISSDSSGLMTWSQATTGRVGFADEVRTFGRFDAPVFLITRRVRVSFWVMARATRSTRSNDSASL